MNLKTIALTGTFDTKGQEFLFVKELIESLGMKTLTIHTGVFDSQFKPDVNNDEVVGIVGEDIIAIQDKKDRAHATAVYQKAWNN